jgi:hypothetical protein
MNKADYIHLFKEACGDKCNAEYNPCVFRQAADNLSKLKPVGYIGDKGQLIYDTTLPHLYRPLYALDSAKHSAHSAETFGKRKWVGLTEDERFKIATEMGALNADWIEFAFEIEKHVRLKNT